MSKITNIEIKAIYLAPIYLYRAIIYARSFFTTLNRMKQVNTDVAKKTAKLIESDFVTIKKALESIESKIPLKSLLSMLEEKVVISDTFSIDLNKVYQITDESFNIVNQDDKTFFKCDNFEITHEGTANTTKVDLCKAVLDSDAIPEYKLIQIKNILDK